MSPIKNKKVMITFFKLIFLNCNSKSYRILNTYFCPSNNKNYNLMVIKNDQGTWKYLLTCTHTLMDMAEASFSIFLACGQFFTSMASTTSQMWLLKQPFKFFSI